LGLLHADASNRPRRGCVHCRYYAPRRGADKAQLVTLSAFAFRAAANLNPT
jgi:hypothetical protein